MSYLAAVDPRQQPHTSVDRAEHNHSFVSNLAYQEKSGFSIHSFTFASFIQWMIDFNQVIYHPCTTKVWIWKCSVQASKMGVGGKSVHSSSYPEDENCCSKCITRVPYATLIALIMNWAGVAVFCGTLYRGVNYTLRMLQDVFQLDKGLGWWVVKDLSLFFFKNLDLIQGGADSVGLYHLGCVHGRLGLDDLGRGHPGNRCHSPWSVSKLHGPRRRPDW